MTYKIKPPPGNGPGSGGYRRKNMIKLRKSDYNRHYKSHKTLSCTCRGQSDCRTCRSYCASISAALAFGRLGR